MGRLAGESPQSWFLNTTRNHAVAAAASASDARGAVIARGHIRCVSLATSSGASGSVCCAMREQGSYEHEQALRSHLHSCGVTSEMQILPSSALSGGQRSRVALAAVSYTAPHVLVMDEPTNNLDLESVAALADCVREFRGAVVVVSHDQFFVNAVCDEAWVVNSGKVKKAASFAAYVERQVRKLER